MLDGLAMIVPLAVPIATMIFLVLYAGCLSERFMLQNYRLVAYLLFVGLACAANQLALRRFSRPSDWAPDVHASQKYRTYLGIMQGSIFTFIAAQGCAWTLTQFSHIVPWLRYWSMTAYFAITFPTCALWLFGLWRMRFWLRQHRSTESIDTMSIASWKWGLFYFNRQDSALMVPARFGIGASYNYARPSVWIAIAVLTLAFSVTAGVLR